MKYYYVYYTYPKGFGSCTFQSKKYFDLKKAKEWIIQEISETGVVIANFIEITKEQFEAGT